MKNLLAFCCIALSVPSFAQSQTISLPKQDSKPSFSLSVIGGLNVNQMLYRPNVRLSPEFTLNDAKKPENAYFLGFSAQQSLSRHFAAKLDAQYVVKGFSHDIQDINLASAEHYQISYLEFSPQIAFKFAQYFQLFLGGYGELRVNERVKYKGQAWSKLHPDVGHLANKADYGLLGGIGIQIDKVSLFAKYAYGLTSAWDTQYSTDVGEIFNAKLYHQSLQIGLGFKLL